MAELTAEALQPSLDEIAYAIIKLSEVGKALAKSRLSKRAIQLLLKDITGVGIREIDDVLAALPQLEQRFLKPLPKKPT